MNLIENCKDRVKLSHILTEFMDMKQKFSFGKIIEMIHLSCLVDIIF